MSSRCNPGTAFCSTNITTFAAISTYVANGACTGRPPNGVLGRRTDLAPSPTQSGHWWPTAAERMHSGQMDRWQRVQLTYVPRSGWR
ncbi:hypothetical protein MMAD_52880 [Mycolicibacterium madagascariense]|uniref:Uncharacterized protein n=1 Tax=Mycolicibacterium madagascariense TaxID=212765 RepID=A0A7I7XPH4_9MYCO|nr:hypothetical protein MMAD_52880 [Mycolicibacterium madagascariense]